MDHASTAREAFAAIGAAASPGTVLVQLRGPEGGGIAEVPLGTPLRELVRPRGRQPAAARSRPLLVGGPTGGLLPAGPPGHPVRLRRAARGGRPHRAPGSVVIADDRACIVDLARLLTRFSADAGVRQDHPVPDRPAPPVRDRRPHRRAARPSPRTRPCSPTSPHDIAAIGAVRPRAPGHPSASPAGCDTSGPSSTTTSFAPPAPPASARRSRWAPVRSQQDPADGRPHHPPRDAARPSPGGPPGHPARLRHDHAARGLPRRAADHDAVAAAPAEHAADPHRGRRPGRSRASRARRSSRSAATTASRSRRCATSPSCRASAPAGCAWSRSRARTTRRSPARARPSRTWWSAPRPTSCAGSAGPTSS